MDPEARRQRRLERLRAVYVPSLATLDPFNPDEDGRLDDVGRQEARQRGMTFYVSPRLSLLDKLYADKAGRPVVLRYCSNSLTPGEARLNKRLAHVRVEVAA